jgi:nucleosome assembly protein 1-like 1
MTGKDVTIKIMKKKPKKGGKPDAKPQIKTEKVRAGCTGTP